MFDQGTRLLLVRHGHSIGNKAWTYLGRTDAPLSEKGEAEAVALADHLKNESLTAVYTSPLKRAVQTAELLSQPHALEPIKKPLLLEQDFGVWEGLTMRQAQEKYRDDYNLWWRDAAQFGPTRGESTGRVANRALRFVAEVREEYPKGTVLIVSHGSLLNALISAVLRTPLRPIWNYQLKTGRVSEVAYIDAVPALMRLNDG